MRNWQRDLRAASFRGVRFWVDQDGLNGGKRIARHEYAGGRTTVLEEAGLATAIYDITAYLLGDESDAQAISLQTVCLAVGPGRLVLPIDGGFLAYVESFNRVRERDRQGYIAFSFTAIPLSNEAGAILGLGDVAAAFLNGFGIAVPGLLSLVDDVVAVVSVCSWLVDLASVLIDDVDDLSNFTSRAAALPLQSLTDRASELLSMAREIGESVASPDEFDALKVVSFSSGDAQDIGAILLAVGLACAGGRAEWISRPQARAGRERIAAVGVGALSIVSAIGAEAADLYGWLTELTQISIRLVSDIAADLVPVVRVETGISLPSSVLAYKLYGDATRAGNLVDIAGSATPMLMPVGFDALES